MSPRSLALALAATSTLFIATGCDPSSTSSASGGAAGAGGEGGSGGSAGCLVTPQPTFALRVLEEDGGFVPPDTIIEVAWSAGNEAPFHLDDPATWGTLETSNMICDVDPAEPPPQDLLQLECALWTSSPTAVRVSAKGYATKERTYTADPMTGCEPKPTPIEIELPIKE